MAQTYRDPNTLFLDRDQTLVRGSGKSTHLFWDYLNGLKECVEAIDAQTQVLGALLPANGGTGVTNLAFTTAGPTMLVVPTAGTQTLLTSGAIGGSTIKTARVTTGPISGGTSALVLVTWPVAYPDTHYTVVASVLDSTASSAALSVVHIESVTASQVSVRVQNTAGGGLTGTVQVIAIHD